MSKFWDNVAKTLHLALEMKEGFEHGQRVVNLALGDDGVIGNLAATGDVFAHVVNLHSDGTYLFQLTQPTLWADFDLYIVNSEGYIVASDTTDQNPSKVQITGRGTCYAFVKSASGSGKYSLMVKRL